MRRAAIGAGVVALAVVAAGSARWPIAPGRVAGSLNAAFGASRVLVWSPPESASFSLFPWPGLRIVDARLDTASGVSLVSAPEAWVALSLPDLLSGRLAPVRVTLSAPTITLDLDRAPFVGRAGLAAGIVALNGFAPLGGIVVTDGVVRLVSRSRGLDTVMDSVNGRLDGLSPSARLNLRLSAVWRAAPLSLSASVEQPRRAMQGKPTAVELSVASALVDVTFRGALVVGATPGAAGDLAVSTHALGDLLRLFGVTPPPTRGADIAISGMAKASPDDLIFDQATVLSRGQSLQGALRLARTGGRLAISGSLDADRLTVEPFFGPFAALTGPDGAWSARALLAAPPRAFDLDLRLSAGRIDAYGLGLDNAAASVLMKDGALTANLIEATVYGGRGTGALALAGDGAAVRAEARGKLAGADLGAAAAQLGWSDLTGKGDAEFALAAKGRSPADFAAGLGGTASLSAEDAAISDVNLEEALRRSQRRPLDVQKDMRSGGTTFERVSFGFAVDDGVARVVDGVLVARGLRASLEGGIDLGRQMLNLRLDAAQTDPAGQAPPDAARLSLNIRGPWSRPEVEPGDPVNGEAIPAAR